MSDEFVYIYEYMGKWVKRCMLMYYRSNKNLWKISDLENFFQSAVTIYESENSLISA